MRRRQKPFPKYQSLENRRLLAGDVSVQVVDSVLNVVGDALANDVAITRSDSGNLVITGNDTTVNGQSEAFEVAQSFRFLSLFMGNGDDSVSLNGLAINRNISFYGEEGNDRLEATNTTAWHLHAEGGAGNDVFDLDMSTRKSAYLYLGDGDDTVGLQSFNAGRNFKIFAGAGNDTIASDIVRAGRRLEIELEAGNDNLLMAGNTFVRREASIVGDDGNDFIAFNPAATESIDFGGRLEVDAGAGNDSLSVGANTSIDAASSFEGGEGTDSIAQSDGSTISDVSGFENTEITGLQSSIDAVFATLGDANINATAFGGASQNEPLSITTSSAALSFTEGNDPIAIDSGIVVAGDAAGTGATISLDGFVTGQDILAFSDTGTITGVFDDQAGSLTLSGDDTLANYQSALRAITFSNTSSSPSTDQRTIQFSITAGDETATASRSLSIVPLNTAPAINFSSSSRSVSLTQLPTTLDDSLTLSDADNTNLAQAIVQISSGFVANEDVLAFDVQSGINATFDPSTGTLTASGSTEIADYQSFLRSVRYENTSATPSTGVRTIRFSVGDGVDTASEDFSLTLQDV